MNEKHKGGDHELMDHDEKFGHTSWEIDGETGYLCVYDFLSIFYFITSKSFLSPWEIKPLFPKWISLCVL